jgi:phenylacetate-CoA ligase
MHMPKKSGAYPFPSPLHDAEAAEAALKTKPASYWEKRGEKAALELFHEAAVRVPAYKDFLKKNGIKHQQIKTIEDFKTIPTIDKKNYLRAYPLADLSWDGKLMDSWQVYAATSGSTGEPFYFPRAQKETDQYALLAELYLRTQFKIQERSTLYVDSFAMGAWIGGLFTYQAIERLAKEGNYKLHLITPGINKDETLKAIRKLGPLYDQVIIGGYPPFTRDLIDEGKAEGMDWKKYNVKFVFSAEGFGERFRDHIFEHASLRNEYRDMLNHYGTVDQGTIAYETPLAIFMRRAALKDKDLYRSLFTEPSRLPTLTQYLPEHFYFETIQNEGLICTANAGLPLIRYDLKDHGGIMSFNHAWKALEKAEPRLEQALKKSAIDDTVFKLPFVHVYERSDFSVVLYGANVYPEHVRKALETKECAKFATGKCALRIVESRIGQPHLEINVELRKGIKPETKHGQVAKKIIVSTLIEHNSEYRSNHTQAAHKVAPRIKLWAFGDPKYFNGRGKQKWVIK